MNNYHKELQQYINFLDQIDAKINDKTEFKFEALKDRSIKGTEKELSDWYWSFVNNSTMKVKKIPLNECRNWNFDNENGHISHSSGEFYRVEGFRITGSNSREVTNGWDQPLSSRGV